MQTFVYSEAGHAHTNEDVAQVQPLADERAVWLCVLADGQGGQPGGGAAAQRAVAATLEAAAACAPAALQGERAWRSIVSGADKSVLQTAGAGYTTLVGVCIARDTLCGASCGDSAALLWNDGQETLLTKGQIKNPPVGSGSAQAVAFSARLGRAWKLLVMSDGVWKYVGWEQVGVLMRQLDGDALIAALREAAASAWGGKLADDFTIGLLQSELR